MFPVVRAHCILTTKLACSFFNDVCIHKSFKCRKICYKVILRPEHQEDISSVYFSNQIFESILTYIKKDMTPTYIRVFVYLPVLLIKRLRIAVFLLIKLKIKKIKRLKKKASRIAVFGCTAGNILIDLFWPYP